MLMIKQRSAITINHVIDRSVHSLTMLRLAVGVAHVSPVHLHKQRLQCCSLIGLQYFRSSYESGIAVLPITLHSSVGLGHA